ncbi:MAG: hypothetical protein GY786_03090 [Proteobacteria bacterium]|nr:hypothetical protein [Pseudomonadota bacterium]
MEKNIKKVVTKNRLSLYRPWVLKIIQLYETSLVRHGFMLVGPTCSGKTTIVKTLIDALSLIPNSKKYNI